MIKDMRDQQGNGRLPIGAGDAQDRVFDQSAAQFNLTNHFNM